MSNLTSSVFVLIKSPKQIEFSIDLATTEHGIPKHQYASLREEILNSTQLQLF